MRAEKLGITLQRFRKYSSSFDGETAGFTVEKRRRFCLFSAEVGRPKIEVVFVRRFWWDVSAGAVEMTFILSRRSAAKDLVVGGEAGYQSPDPSIAALLRMN